MKMAHLHEADKYIHLYLMLDEEGVNPITWIVVGSSDGQGKVSQPLNLVDHPVYFNGIQAKPFITFPRQPFLNLTPTQQENVLRLLLSKSVSRPFPVVLANNEDDNVYGNKIVDPKQDSTISEDLKQYYRLARRVAAIAEFIRTTFAE